MRKQFGQSKKKKYDDHNKHAKSCSITSFQGNTNYN